MAIVVVAGVVFAQTVAYPFLSWDDERLLLGHAQWRGLGLAELRFMWTTTELGHRVPLTWLSWALDHALWGLWAGGYHLTNVLLHAANAGLVYLLGRRLIAKATGAAEPGLTVGAGLAALLFAVHPLRVESVSWITERRGLLSGALVLGATLAYLGAVEQEGAPRRRGLAVAGGLYALALLAKSSVMAWPVVLLVLDWYPLRRLAAAADWRRALLEKALYLPVAVGGAVLAYQAQTAGWERRAGGWVERAANAAYTLATQLGRTLWPAHLSPLYEAPVPLDPGEPRFVVSALVVGGLTALLLVLGRRWPAGLAAWLAYAVMLSPVLGLVPLGDVLTADRYSYLACLGWTWLAGAGATFLIGRAGGGQGGSRLAVAATAGLALAVLGLATLAVQQTWIWRHPVDLWSRAVRVDPDSGLAHAQLGFALERAGKLDRAIEHHRLAARLRPRDGRVLLGLGQALVAAGDAGEALPVLEQAERLRPTAEAHVSLGLALSLTGHRAAAIAHYRTAIRLDSQVASAHNNLGILLLQEGRREEAAASFRRALEVAPDLAEARRNLEALGRAAPR